MADQLRSLEWLISYHQQVQKSEFSFNRGREELIQLLTAAHLQIQLIARKEARHAA